MRKKVTILILMVTLISMLLSCSKLEKDPYDLKKRLKSEDFDYNVYLEDNEDQIKDIVDTYDTRPKGVECVLQFNLSYSNKGLVVYCDSVSSAKKIKDDLSDYLNKKIALKIALIEEIIKTENYQKYYDEYYEEHYEAYIYGNPTNYFEQKKEALETMVVKRKGEIVFFGYAEDWKELT